MPEYYATHKLLMLCQSKRTPICSFDVLPPFVIYRTSRMNERRFAEVRDMLGQRLDNLWKTGPIPFRPQNGGAYEIPALTLRPDGAPGSTGFPAHTE